MKPLTIKKKLCERAGGIWIPSESGKGGTCKGGLCEHCGKPPDFRGLHPHELTFRGRGGKLSMKNSEEWCGKCHHGLNGHRTENMPRSQPIDKPDSINVLLGHYGNKFRPVSVEMQIGKR